MAGRWKAKGGHKSAGTGARHGVGGQASSTREAVLERLCAASRICGMPVLLHDYLATVRLPRAWTEHLAAPCLARKEEDGNVRCAGFCGAGGETDGWIEQYPDGRVHCCPDGWVKIAVPLMARGYLAGILHAGPAPLTALQEHGPNAATQGSRGERTPDVVGARSAKREKGAKRAEQSGEGARGQAQDQAVMAGPAATYAQGAPVGDAWRRLEDVRIVLAAVARDLERILEPLRDLLPSTPSRNQERGPGPGAGRGSGGSDTRPDGGPARSDRADRILAYLNTCRDRPARLEELAGRLNLSPSRTRRLVVELFGKPLSELSNNLRLQRAASLLELTDRPLSAIALALGFCDQSHFSKRFAKAFGVTPLRYRKSLLASDPALRPDEP